MLVIILLCFQHSKQIRVTTIQSIFHYSIAVPKLFLLRKITMVARYEQMVQKYK